ncbi:Thymidylate kinase [subsurface metagenome]
MDLYFVFCEKLLTTSILFIELTLDTMSDSTSAGFLICLEGIDGSGKTTHSKLLVECLCSLSYDAEYTTEPTKWSEQGKKLRESFFAPTRLSAEEEFKLFLEDRKLHLKEEVIPLLNQGKIIVTDRYYFSSVAYQGSRGLSWKYILNENMKIAIEPKIVILLDLSVDEAVERISNERTHGTNTFEKHESLQRVRNIYLKLVNEFPDLFFLINVSREKEDVHRDILNIILERIKK